MAEAIQLNELVVLIIIILGYIPVLMAFRSKRTVWLFLAYTALLMGAILTISEGFFYPTVTNYAEHSIGIMAAGLLFFLCAYLNSKKLTTIEQQLKNKVKRWSK